MGGLRGSTPSRVRAAIAAEVAFTGEVGFAGALPDGRLVRDVLGRRPLFFDPGRPTEWSFEPIDRERTRAVPAGTVVEEGAIRQVWSLPTRPPFDDDPRAIDEIRMALERALAGVDAGDLAVAFSGGLDSALLASRLEVPAYVTGFPDSPDVRAARSAAGDLGTDLRVRELDHDTLEAAVRIVATATGRINAMDVAIGSALYLVADRAAADGYDRLVLGQGADELFGGYEKIARLDHRVGADTVRGARREVLEELPAGLARDVLAVRAAGVVPVMPYLDDRVILAALRLDGHHLVRDGTRKWALREVAAETLPTRLALRDKQAVQYGSRVATEIDRLARRAGFKRHTGDHVSRYVASLLDDSG